MSVTYLYVSSNCVYKTVGDKSFLWTFGGRQYEAYWSEGSYKHPNSEEHISLKHFASLSKTPYNDKLIKEILESIE